MAVTTGAPEAKMNGLVFKYNWLAIINGNNGNPIGSGAATEGGAHVDLAVYADKCIQFTGTWGAGGSVNLEGSNDGGTTWAILKDANGNAITMTSAGMAQITENPEQIRPRVTAGDGTTAINAYLYMRKIII